MQDKEAAKILMRMGDKHALSDEEKEAVSAAIGILSWTALGQSRIKNIAKAQKAKKEFKENKFLK